MLLCLYYCTYCWIKNTEYWKYCDVINLYNIIGKYIIWNTGDLEIFTTYLTLLTSIMWPISEIKSLVKINIAIEIMSYDLELVKLNIDSDM